MLKGGLLTNVKALRVKGGTGKGMNKGNCLSLILTTDKRVNGVEWLWQGWPTLSHSLYPSFGNLALTVDFGDISCARMPPRRAAGTSSTDTLACTSASEFKAISACGACSNMSQRQYYYTGHMHL
jgi:hypothetical protein